MLTNLLKSIIILSLIISKLSAATNQISVKVLFGYPMTTFSAGEVYEGEDLAATLFLKPEIMLHFPSYNIASFAYFAMHLMSPFGLIPLAGMGVGALYYPSGFPIITGSANKNTELLYKKFAPYFGLGLGISRMSVSDANENISFLSNTLDLTAIGGFDYPLSNRLSTGLEASYSSSFIGGSKNNSGSLSNNASFNFCISISYYP